MKDEAKLSGEGERSTDTSCSEASPYIYTNSQSKSLSQSIGQAPESPSGNRPENLSFEGESPVPEFSPGSTVS